MPGAGVEAGVGGLLDHSSLTYNLLILVGVMTLAFAVKYVLTTAYEAEQHTSLIH